MDMQILLSGSPRHIGERHREREGRRADLTAGVAQLH
jgi:hypothetical protein